MGHKQLFNLAIGLVALLVLLVPGSASAITTGLNLTTSPLPIRLTTTPGSTVSTTLRVKNSGPQTEKLKVGLMKFGASSQTGQPNLFERGPKDNYFDWVSFTPSTFTAPPNQWMEVKMAIKVPKDAGLGYYYAVTFQRVAPDASNPASKSQASIVGATATLVLLDVKSPNEQRTMQLASFTADHRFYQYLPAAFSVQVRNIGNIFIAPTGNIFIKKGGKAVATLDVNPAGGSILPNSPRAFTTSWRDGFPVYVDKQLGGKPLLARSGEPLRKLSWDVSQIAKLRFGKYTADALLVYNDGQHDVPLQAELSFWVVPWSLLLLIVLVPTVPAVAVYLIMHRRLRKRRNWRGTN